MDRRELLFAAALLLAAVLVSGGLAYAVALPFQEGFEDTETGVYPSGDIWNNLSSASALGAYVTEEEHLGGSKSFRLNSCWLFAPQMDYVVLDELPAHLSYEAAVCVHATSGLEALVGFMDGYNSTYPMWNFFCVEGATGSVSFCGEEQVALGSYTPGDWCTVRADLNYESLTAKLWVNGELVAQGVEITPREFNYAPLGDIVTDQWGVVSTDALAWSNIVYFDDLHLWESITLLTVDIDIKPGSATNPINLTAEGVLPVCVFSSETFDATRIDPFTCELAGAPVALRGEGEEEPLAHVEDVDGDGLLDMMLQFEIQQLDPLQLAGGWAVLVGSLTAGDMVCATSSQGDEFVGMDQVALVMHRVRTRGRDRR